MLPAFLVMEITTQVSILKNSTQEFTARKSMTQKYAYLKAILNAESQKVAKL